MAIKNDPLEKRINKLYKKLHREVKFALAFSFLHKICIKKFSCRQKCDKTIKQKIKDKLWKEQEVDVRDFESIYNLVIARYNEYLAKNGLKYRVSHGWNSYSYDLINEFGEFGGVEVETIYYININLLDNNKKEKNKDE